MQRLGLRGGLRTARITYVRRDDACADAAGCAGHAQLHAFAARPDIRVTVTCRHPASVEVARTSPLPSSTLLLTSPLPGLCWKLPVRISLLNL